MDDTTAISILQNAGLAAYMAHPYRDSICLLLESSAFIRRHSALLQALLADHDWEALTRDDYDRELMAIDPSQSFSNYGRALRRFRNTHLIRLCVREWAGLSDTQNTLEQWSDCAECLLWHALNFCQQELHQRYGQCQAELYMIAMGKLGGRELNFSSDVDLIFTYHGSGQTHGPTVVDIQHFYTLTIQRFVQLLQDNTADGFVFRVDLRLRPFGESGPLLMSLAAMETYYQEQGRDWERYAMVKARVLGPKKAPWFDRIFLPFVYRRYVDYSVIEALRSMKSMIIRELAHQPRLDDIKRGTGGIREIEFIIQNVQLIRGGRLLSIRQRNVVLAIGCLAREGLLDRHQVLLQSYLFYRKLENALQIQEDQQTHRLPQDSKKRAQIAALMQFSDVSLLLERLEQYQRIVSQLFQSVLRDGAVFEDEQRTIFRQLHNLWLGHVEKEMAINSLVALNFSNAERCFSLLQSFKNSARVRRTGQTAQMRLDRFMVLLLWSLKGRANGDQLLLQAIHLLEKIVGRSAYLALFAENITVLQEVLEWFEHSPFISKLLIQHPFLLETLVDTQPEWRPWSRKQLEAELSRKLHDCADDEQFQAYLRQFKLKAWLMVARSEMKGRVNALQVGRFLADLAQVIVDRTSQRVCSQMGQRFPELLPAPSRFAVIAYGKAGSREMNYDSDVDIVFLHRLPVKLEFLATRLSQKILHFLTMRGQDGVLYSVDTRLRPSGSAGLLVSRLDAFVGYQFNQAWVWEHQALLKARVISGDRVFRKALYQLKQSVIALERDPASLQSSVLAMRDKIGFSEDNKEIKRQHGGLLDIEFLLQYLVLARREPQFARYSNTYSWLRQLYLRNYVSSSQFAYLKEGYQSYHQMLHQQVLSAEVSRPSVDSRQVESIIADVYAQTAR
ncbi:MAG: bifunctional [glutamate--ammonia ligase]-adenylyl-L-tyrosine phosphorylase/[glutamate--ammonia-ligase] adenylyltransferase [Legionellaceae bacterium]|nr:bifunctional [glutamate--ammonia ligase]-adenylyl-L-tyrosine phosphorylase/[glutamate--ammonia-ligase] adenylyltransferase [Legionellaceae bacterium]